MTKKKKYKKRLDKTVLAIQLDLDTKGFVYQKWGATQTCKQYDWLVNNSGDIYTVDDEVFKKTYIEVTPGIYSKHSYVWAEEANKSGAIKTLEGETNYMCGDYLVFNDKEGSDVYAVSREMFEELYELVE